jgi:hypothetical protein
MQGKEGAFCHGVFGTTRTKSCRIYCDFRTGFVVRQSIFDNVAVRYLLDKGEGRTHIIVIGK